MTAIAPSAPLPRDVQRRIARESYAVFALGLLLFLLGIWQQPFVDFESRFALFAQEMWRHGITLFPTTYGEPYPDYPVTGTLLIWLCSLPFGGVTQFAAVLPTAVATAFNFAILYRLLARYARSWAAIALCLQLMTATFIAEARSISLDQMLATLTLATFYLVHSAREDGRRCELRWLMLLLLAGFAVRGPLGVVIPTAVVIAYRAVEREWRELLRFGLLALALLLAAWAALLFGAQQVYGSAFMHDVVRMEAAGRMKQHINVLPYYYYFTSSIGNYALAYPLAAVALAAAVPALRRGPRSAERHLLLLLVAWIAIVIVGLSIPQGKKARYLLPIVPALAAVAAYPWVDRSARGALAWYRFALQKLFLVLPLILLGGLVWARRYAARHALELGTALAVVGALLIAAQLLAFWLQWRAKPERRAVPLAVIAAFSFWLCAAFIVEPARIQLHDTATFTARVETARAARPGTLVMLDTAKDGEAIKYMVNLHRDVQPVFAATAADLATVPRPCYVVVSDSDLDALAPAALTAAKRVVHARFDGHLFSAFYLP